MGAVSYIYGLFLWIYFRIFAGNKPIDTQRIASDKAKKRLSCSCRWAFPSVLSFQIDMKRRRLRKNKHGLISPRRLLDNGSWQRLTFAEKVFTALTWCGFTNAEAWGVVNPMSEASPNSRAVMAGRFACSPQVKVYVEVLNRNLLDGKLGFKGQVYKVMEQCRAVDDWRSENE